MCKTIAQQVYFSGTTRREMVLLYGCRHHEKDHLYKDEVEIARKAGAISHTFTAFSRIPGLKKVSWH